ncbi:hypothetical protein Godav_026895 [Gossypium davidsonii]|uniref:Uncharacterized protein n=2 Tax=Gossypium TaxID=3633 RepID=A0A7J8RUG5_GOSDV|nr:hypothetical protein [Gossypium davidsonii]MBA0652774.1 hypothetical protein [Gossypium klotzschianum]
MGSEEDKILESKMKGSKKTMNTFMACLWSFLVSLGGGLLLAWWEYQYHPTNRQLWMVPFGLILFFTPLIVWFAIFVSDIFSLTPDVTQPAASIHHPEKLSKQGTPTNEWILAGVRNSCPRPQWKPSVLCDLSKCHNSNMKVGWGLQNISSTYKVLKNDSIIIISNHIKLQIQHLKLKESNRDMIDAKAFTLTAIIEIDAQETFDDVWKLPTTNSCYVVY